ncbi:hypothetical protein ACLMJK_009464 [Lecanora helva]
MSLKKGEYARPQPGDLRSPCPGLNALANHGYLPRDGRNMHYPETFDALGQFGLSWFFKWLLAWPTFLERKQIKDKRGFWAFIKNPRLYLLNRFGGALAKFGCRFPGQIDSDRKNWINLDQTQQHEAIEVDVSLTRLDHAQGDNHSLQQKLLKDLLASSTNGKTITFNDFVEFRRQRYEQQKRDNPNLFFHDHELGIGCGNIAMLLKVFGNGKEVPIEYMKAFFQDERLPVAEGWRKRRWWSVGLLEIASLNKKLQNIIGLPDERLSSN